MVWFASKNYYRREVTYASWIWKTLIFHFHYSIPRRFVSGNLYEFLCSCFGSGTTSKIFTKLLKIPISIPGRKNIRIGQCIYKYLGIFVQYAPKISKMKEIRLSRDTVIFLLHYLEFVLNLKKSFVNPMQEIEFLGITINYLKMCLSLPQTFLTITTDASKKAYGAACQTIPTGGNVIYSNKDFILIYWEKTSKTCIASTSQTVLGECCSFLKRQYSNPVLSCENGG